MTETAPTTDFETSAQRSKRPELRFDVEDWLPYMADSEASQEDKEALLETLWSIVIGFVDLGWEVKPAAEICGESIDLKALLEAGMVDSGVPQPDTEEALHDNT